MLWEDTCPKKFDDFHIQTSLIQSLKNLSQQIKRGECLPNIIIYGQEQSGKYTLAKCLLQEIYGNGIYNTSEIEHNIRQNCSNYSIRLNKSSHHYETSFSGLQYADRSMLVSLLDDYFSTADISTNQHKIILIKHFDELTKPAQYALRRRMEKAWGAVRYILIVKSYNKIENAIKSRCLSIRCPKPTNDEIKISLHKLVTARNIKASDEMIQRATNLSNNIISNAIYYLSYMVESNKMDLVCPIETAIGELITCLHIKPFPYDKLRDIIAKLQLSRIPHAKIFICIMDECSKFLKDNSTMYQIVKLSAECDIIASNTNKFSIAVETFVVSVYNILRAYEKNT